MRPSRARRDGWDGQARCDVPQDLPKELGKRLVGLACAPVVESSLRRADHHAGDQPRIQVAAGVGAGPVGDRRGQRDFDRRVQPPLRPLFWGYVRTPPEQRDLAALETARVQAVDVLRIADAVLAAQPYLTGTELTPGDIPLGCFVNRWYHLPIERPRLAGIEAWYQRLQARPGYRQHVMVPLT